MGNAFTVEFLSPNQLRRQAESFLRRYHPTGAIPVPIEDIVDLHFRIDIIPLPGLRSGFDVEAFITSNMEAIYVDDDIYRNYINRFRFSLAHEIAHAVLHQKVFRSLSFSSVADWKQMQTSFPPKEYGSLEWQAYTFAGLILVPSDVLLERFKTAVQRAEREGISLVAASDMARHIIAGALAPEFEVSTSVIDKRIAFDGLWEDE